MAHNNRSDTLPRDAGAPIDASSPAQGSLFPIVARAATVIAFLYALFHIYTALFGSFDNLIQRSIHVCFALVLTFLTYRAGRDQSKGVPLVDWLLLLVSIAATAWIAVSYDRFMSRQALNSIDLVLGVGLIVAVVEAVRRIIGLSFALLAGGALAYAWLGPNIPMPFAHRGFSVHQIVNHLYTTDLGLWGTTTGVTATVVAVFIIFGAVLLETGGAAKFMDISLLAAGRFTGGPAKVATLASSLFGSVSGSAVANVAVTGSFTIPMMRKLGYDRNFASAVEATASTGGQLMPPLMGAGAFIMAELIGVPYTEIMIAASIPAFLFYLGVFVAIHQTCTIRGYAALPPADIPTFREAFSLREVLPLFAAIIVVVYFLLAGASAQRAGIMGTLTAAGLFLLSDLRPDGILVRARTLIRALETAGRSIVMIAVLAAAAQILIGVIGLTGFGVRFTQILLAASNDSLLIGLLIGMVVALILGMGMPTTGAYLIAASVLAPALIRLGAPTMSAHLFVFYFAIISAITPPVCAAVFVSSGIAASNWFRSALLACRIGLVAFIIPFMFVNSQGLLLDGEPLSVLIEVVLAVIGVVALASGVMGHFIAHNRLWEALLLVPGAVLSIHPNPWTDVAGIALIAIVVVSQITNPRKVPSRVPHNAADHVTLESGQTDAAASK